MSKTRQILNFFILGIVIWIASLLFPENIKFSGFPAIILTTLLVYFIETLLILGVFLGLAALKIRRLAVWIIILVFFALFGMTASFLIVAYLYDGFSVSGFWSAFLLALGCSIFTVSIKPNQ